MAVLAPSRRAVLEQQLAGAEETGRCLVEVGVCDLRGLLDLAALADAAVAWLESWLES